MTNNFKSICIKTEFSAYHFIDYAVFEIIDPRKKKPTVFPVWTEVLMNN